MIGDRETPIPRDAPLLERLPQGGDPAHTAARHRCSVNEAAAMLCHGCGCLYESWHGHEPCPRCADSGATRYADVVQARVTEAVRLAAKGSSEAAAMAAAGAFDSAPKPDRRAR